jgi:hypothetical protein
MFVFCSRGMRAATQVKRFVARGFRVELSTTNPPQRYSFAPLRGMFVDRISRRAYVELVPLGGFVRSVARLCLVVLLVSSLLNIPAFAATEKPLGLVVQAQEAQLDDAKLAVGTSIYRGDTLVTEAGGGLRVKLGGSQLYLLAESAATLEQNTTAIHAVVARGTVGFSSNGTDSIELQIPQGILRAANGQPAYGQVTILSAQEVVISAYRGGLVLDNDGELHTIPAGKNYRVTMEFDQADQQTSPASTGGDNPIVQPQNRHRRRRLAFYLIFTGAMAGITYAIWDHLSESPSTPQ